MMGVIQSSEFWAAVAGGLLSLLGSYFSLRWQSKNTKKERLDLYLTFYKDSFLYVSSVIKDLESVWDSDNYASFHHLNQIERIINAIDRHMDGFALIDDRNLRDALRRFFFDLSGDIGFLRYWEQKREEAKVDYQKHADKESVEARAAQTAFLEANNLITKRISAMKSKSSDIQHLMTGT